MRPETKYALSGDVSIAYQVIGGGSIDIVYIPGFLSHLEYAWEDPNTVRLLEGLASFARLICFDKRGTGLSDRNVSIPTLEHRMDDVRAVMDAAGSERACLFGTSEGGPMSLLFSATFPGRATAMALYGSYARLAWAPDHRCGRTREELMLASPSSDPPGEPARRGKHSPRVLDAARGIENGARHSSG